MEGTIMKFMSTTDNESANVDKSNTRSMANGIYLDGDVEKSFGYDCVILSNYDEFPYYETALNGKCVKLTQYSVGIHECEVINYKYPCYAYIWYDMYDNLHGLICDKRDFKSMSYARRKYELKSCVC